MASRRNASPDPSRRNLLQAFVWDASASKRDITFALKIPVVGELVTEAQLRDAIARDVSVLGEGLVLLKKEQYIPNDVGTRGFIDLYARDQYGHHVLIELKKSDASSRQALHEIHKYVEGVKSHMAVRDHEIRVIVASTEWDELIVPFSRLVSDSPLSLEGLEIHVDAATGAISASRAQLVPIRNGRFISPKHEINFYSDENSLKRGVASIESCFERKRIDDYVIAILKPRDSIHSNHQAKMWHMLAEVGNPHDVKRIQAMELPSYQYVAYVANHELSRERCLEILSLFPDELNDALEIASALESDEALDVLQEHCIAAEPRPDCDYLEVGYPAKFSELIEDRDCAVLELKRYGMFARNTVLRDEVILGELRGEDGKTGQRFKRTVKVSNRAHMRDAKVDAAACLEQNPIWQSHIMRVLDEAERAFPDAEIDISIFNPATGIFTIFYALTDNEGIKYIPTYSVVVKNPDPVRMWYGVLEGSGEPLPFRLLLQKYYDNDIGQLLLTSTWGGRESRDADVVEDMGLSYRSYRCDIEGAKRTFSVFRDERWRECGRVMFFEVFRDYVNKNESLVHEVLTKIGTRLDGGVFNGSSAETALDDVADVAKGEAIGAFYSSAPERCDICGCLMCLEKYMIDGRIAGDSAGWANMCADCHLIFGGEIAWGSGQLYLRHGGRWLCVGGFRPRVD